MDQLEFELKPILVSLKRFGLERDDLGEPRRSDDSVRSTPGDDAPAMVLLVVPEIQEEEN